MSDHKIAGTAAAVSHVGAPGIPRILGADAVWVTSAAPFSCALPLRPDNIVWGTLGTSQCLVREPALVAGWASPGLAAEAPEAGRPDIVASLADTGTACSLQI